ncbi:MAG: TonB-dependent receptor [Steroidobacteraceae bacterium]
MPIWAQDVGNANEGLEEIIVTAEKRPQDAQKTAISITTISGEEIRERGDNQLSTVLQNVPSLSIQTTSQGGNIYIRGVGTNGDSNSVDPTVATSIDGVYSARSERISAAMYDISRVEVLRGPQGTIYGRNADGGAVNVVSNGPQIGNDDGRVNLQVGNYNLRHIDAAQNLSLTDDLAIRVAGVREKRDGYFSNGGQASDVTGGRLKVLYKPLEAWTLQGLLDYSRQKGKLSTTVPMAGGPWETDSDDPWYVDPTHPADTIDFKFVTMAVQSDYDLGWGSLTVIPTLTKSARYVDGNLITGIDSRYNGALNASINRETQKTAEVRLSSPASSAINWVVGYYYLWSDNAPTGNTGTTTVDVTDSNDDTIALYQLNNLGASPSTSKAPFGQITYPLTESLHLTAGARYTQDAKSNATHITSVAIPGYDSGQIVRTANYSSTTYKLGLDYDLAPQSMVYGQVSTGYKAGGFYTAAVPPRAYRPEYLTAYEVGSKNRFLDDSLQVNGSVYYYRYKDLQVQYVNFEGYPLPDAYIPDTVTNSTFSLYIANAGAGINKGAELEVQYKFAAHDQLNASYSYTDARYGDFDATRYPSLVSLNGQPMAMTPRNSATFGYQHDWAVFGGKLSAQANTKLSSSYWASITTRDNGYSFQKAYTRSDASVTFNSSGDRWSLSGWVKNIEDKAQLQYGEYPLYRAVVNSPRTFGVNASIAY